MSTRSDQPSETATEEAVPTDQIDVVTSDLEAAEPGSATSDDDQTANPAASSDKPDQTPEASAAEDNDKDQPSRKGDRRAERRIKQLTRKLARAEADRDAEKTANRETVASLRREIADLRQGQAAASAEPRLEDYADPKEFARDFAKWEQAQAGSKADQSAADESAVSQDKPSDKPDTPAGPDEDLAAFHRAAIEKHGDQYQEALQVKGIAVDQEMGEFMLDSEFGSDIYIHLAANIAESAQIFDMPAEQKAEALEALEAKAAAGTLIKAPGKVDTTSEPPAGDTGGQDDGASSQSDSNGGGTVTSAKEPPSDTRDTGSVPPRADPERESMDDYAARRTREIAQREGRRLN